MARGYPAAGPDLAVTPRTGRICPRGACVLLWVPMASPAPIGAARQAAMDDRMLFRRYRRDRDPATRDALVERYMPLARRLARVYPAGGELEDLFQVASLALVRAVERYEPDRGFAFSTYATPTILGELKRYFREQGWAVRVPRRLQDRCLEVDRVAAPLAARYGRHPTPGEIAASLGIDVEEVLEALAVATVRRSESIERLFPGGSREVDRSVGAEEDPGFARIETACW